MRHLAHFRRFGGQVAPLGAFEPLPAQSCATWRVQTTLSPKLRHLTRANGSQPRLRHLTRFRRFGAKVAPLEASRTAPAKVAPLDATQTDVVRRHLPGECNNLAWGAQHRSLGARRWTTRSNDRRVHARTRDMSLKGSTVDDDAPTVPLSGSNACTSSVSASQHPHPGSCGGAPRTRRSCPRTR